MLFDDFPLLDNRRLYLPSLDDVAMVVKDFTITEITTLVGLILWSLLLFVPLKGIDRRDNITGLTYLLYLLAGGVTLAIAIPGKLTTIRDLHWQAGAVVAFALVAGFKWIKRPSVALAKVRTERSEEKKP